MRMGCTINAAPRWERKDTTGMPIMLKPLPSHSGSLFFGANCVSVYETKRKRDRRPNKAEHLEMIHNRRLPGKWPFLPSHQAERGSKWNRKMKEKAGDG